MTDAEWQPPVESIAVVGMSGRFPGALNIDEFWGLLKNGVDAIRHFTPSELAEAGVDAATMLQPGFVPAHGYIENADLFDAGFFGYNAADARLLDPQLRCFLECAWEGLEDAGYDPETYPGLIGVYGGCSTSSYMFQIYGSGEIFDPIQIALATDKDHLATQVSYRMNLKGPSATVQCACSTSLVAVAMACQSLLDFHCDIALAGGVSIGVPLKKGYVYQEGGILSPDGQCRAYDAKASGTVAGSGGAVVVLKRLSEALSESDTIHAVIRGWALTNDGSAKVSYTAPSVEGQARAIALAQAVAGVRPESIGFVEGHGTGTDLGDPVEVAALTQAFGAYTAQREYCALGSVKSNIGHLDAAAGVAGLIKAILATKHATVPPTVHFEAPNPKIDMGNTPFYVPSRAMPWPAELMPRRAGVSSFGMGGTNAHVIVEEPPAAQISGPSRRWQMLPLSAKTPAALDRMAANLRERLRGNPDLPFADVAFTLQTGRRSFSKKRYVIAQSSEEACAALESGPSYSGDSAREMPAAFLFPGQGSQYVNMLRAVYNDEPIFREDLDNCSELLKPFLGVDVRKLIYPHESGLERAFEQLTQTSIAQPALFVVEYALARLWMHFGVHPAAAIGHSIGEYVAACLSQVISLEDALWLIAQRGRLMEGAPRGAMLSVAASEADLAAVVGERLSIAAVNGPVSCVISGDIDAIGQAAAEFIARGVACRKLHTSHAFHSSLMDSVLDEFSRCVEMVRLQPPQVPFLSNLTGDWITAQEATDPKYWVLQLRRTVRFHASVERLLNDAEVVLLEVGPGTALTSLCRQRRTRGKAQVVIPTSRHSEQNEPDEEVLAHALGQLWLNGVPIDWRAYHSREARKRVPLPTYPFERQRYWIDAKMDASAAGWSSSLAPRLAIEDWFHVHSWRPATSGADLRISGPEHRRRTWLLLADDPDLSSAIANLLREGEQNVLQARRYDDGMPVPDVVLHLFNCTNSSSDLDIDKQRAFYDLLDVAKAVGSGHANEPVEIGVIATHLHSLPCDRHPIEPIKALLQGPCTVIPQEYPHLHCRSVDVVVEPGCEALVAQQLINEFTSEPFAPAVAYRDHLRWIRGWEKVRLEPQPPAFHARLRESGVYLITGGLGGIGLVLAQYLAKQIRAKLILLGRTGLPLRTNWPEWLRSRAENDTTSIRIRAVNDLEALGAEVLPLSADVADRLAMHDAIRTGRERFGPLNGIIHAAGVAGGGIIELKTRDIAERVFAPKVAGTLVLGSLARELDLDFFAICSSLSAVLGGAGQVDYCAANNFQDAFAARHHHELAVFSINWDAWQEVGMAVNTEIPESEKAVRALTLLDAIRPAEGAEAFGRILSTRLVQVAVSTTGLDTVLSPPVAVESAALFTSPAAISPEAHARPDLSVAFEAPQTENERTVASLWETLLGIQPVGRNDSFFELGGHSLLAIQFISRIREITGTQLAVSDLFEASTVAGVAARLDPQGASGAPNDWRRLLEEVESLSDDEVTSGTGQRLPTGAS
jgi:acyl transferase domain-containing protein